MPMMRGASAPKEESKETLLKTKYKLDGSLPFDLKKWSSKKISRSSGGIPYEEREGDQMDNMSEDTFGAERAAISQVFKDDRVNLQQRELIARSLLEGKYNIVGSNDGMNGETKMQSIEFDEHGRPVKPVYDQDIMRGTAQVNRARMRPLNFLEANGEQMDIILVDPRTVMEYEHTKNVERVKSPNKGKRGLYSWGGKTVAEEVLPIRVEIRKEEEDRMKNSFMSTSKKTMYLDAKKRDLERTKEYLKWQKEAARRSRIREGDRKQETQLKREAIRRFRGDLRKHLEANSNPMLGTIMRYVDDKVAWNIMNAYRGHAMSMDMVVGLVGQTLGTLETASEEAKQTEISGAPAGGNIGNPGSFITEVETSEDVLHMAVNPPPPLDDDAPPLVEAENKDFDDSVVSQNEIRDLNEVHVKGIVDKGDFLKPYSAGHKGKFIAKDNLFAPQGLKKKGPQELPYTDEIVKYSLRSRPGTGTATSKDGRAASPEGVPRRPGTGSRRSGGAVDEKKELKPHEMKQHWNSEMEGDMRHPYDRIQIEKQSGEIRNISAWYSSSNPGSRTNTPSESGLKGWNAGEVTMKKTAAGFMAKLDGSGSLEKNIVDEIFAGDDAFRQSMNTASQSLYFASMQSFIDESKAVGNPDEICHTTASISASVDDSTAAQTAAEVEEEWVHAKPLADAIEQEKIALGTIPKYQPEKVLSDEQLNQLGEKQISIDTIAAQMRWAKQKKARQLEEQRKLGEGMDISAVGTRMMTSQSLGDLNAMTTDLDPKGGVAIQTNQFSNMDVEMGFKPMPERGSHEDIGINPAAGTGIGAGTTQLPSLMDGGSQGANKSASMVSAAKSGSLFSLENPREIQRLLDSNISAPPKQLKTALSKMPESPFKTYEAKMKVINSGVSSSAGFGLWLSEQERAARLQKWGPRSKSREGRFRVGQSSNMGDPGFSPTKDEVNKKKKRFGQLLS